MTVTGQLFGREAIREGYTHGLGTESPASLQAHDMGLRSAGEELQGAGGTDQDERTRPILQAMNEEKTYTYTAEQMSIAERILELATPDVRPVRLWYVTGTYHGSHVYSRSEGDARRTFHTHYNGESIVHISGPKWPDPIPYYDPNDADTY